MGVKVSIRGNGGAVFLWHATDGTALVASTASMQPAAILDLIADGAALVGSDKFTHTTAPRAVRAMLIKVEGGE